MMKKRSLIFPLLAFAGCVIPAQAIKMSDLKVYINPGHGGYDSDDRNIKVYPFEQGDTAGYWESKSNLWKGLHMYNIIDSICGTTADLVKPNVMLSRTTNTSADDRSLGGISREANEWVADFFLSIHSNAGENVNYLLMLYREDVVTENPLTTAPRYEGNKTVSEIVGNTLQSNEMANWTRQPRIEGDVSFYYPGWGTSGLGVLRGLYTVGLLSEGGMHEHRPQAYRLLNDDYCWLEAWHFVHSIMEYFDTEDRFVTGNVAGVVYDDHNLREMDVPTRFTTYGFDDYAPVCGAYVELIDASGKVVQTRLTDNLYNGVFVLRNITPGEYTLRISKNGYYTDEKKVVVTANEVTYSNTPLNMKREFPLEAVVESPEVGSDGLVSCSSPITFRFNSDIYTDSLEKAFSVTPAVAGYWKYSENNHVASFIPEVSWSPDVTYTVKVDQTVCTPDKHYANPQLKEPIQFNFTTRNRSRLSVLEHYPADGGSVHYAGPTLEVRFDNTINTAGMKDLVTITDADKKEIGLSTRGCQYNKLTNGYGNAVYALLGDLEVGKKYTFKLSSELRDTESLPLGEDLQFDFYATNVTDREEVPVIEPFEAPSVMAGDIEASKGLSVKPSVAKSTNPKLFDKAAVKMSYSFAETHDGVAVWNYTPETVQPLETGDCLGLYVNGDFSNHELWMGVTSGTDTKWHLVCTLSFRGWEYHEVTLDDLEAGYIYNVDMFKIVQVESPVTQKGSVVLDNMVYRNAASGGVNDILAGGESNVNIYPVPADSEITVDGVEVANLQLINVAGAVVAEVAGGSHINVSSLASGIYLLRIATCDGNVIVARVVVAH